MKNVTRVRVTDRMVRVVKYIKGGSAISAPELFKQTKAFPSLSAVSVCLWNLARLGILVRGVRRGGNGETPFFLSDDMMRAANGEVVDDRRMMEISERIKAMKPVAGG